MTTISTTLTKFLNVSHKSKHATLGRWYSTARVSKRPSHWSAACLRARYCTNLTCSDLVRSADGCTHFRTQRHQGHRYPAFFATMRLGCKTQWVLQVYAGRWSCDVVNFHLETHSGLADFRVRSYEACDNHVVAAHLAL